MIQMKSIRSWTTRAQRKRYHLNDEIVSLFYQKYDEAYGSDANLTALRAWLRQQYPNDYDSKNAVNGYMGRARRCRESGNNAITLAAKCITTHEFQRQTIDELAKKRNITYAQARHLKTKYRNKSNNANINGTINSSTDLNDVELDERYEGREIKCDPNRKCLECNGFYIKHVRPFIQCSACENESCIPCSMTAKYFDFPDKLRP
eukprot:501130_1